MNKPSYEYLVSETPLGNGNWLLQIIPVGDSGEEPLVVVLPRKALDDVLARLEAASEDESRQVLFS